MLEGDVGIVGISRSPSTNWKPSILLLLGLNLLQNLKVKNQEEITWMGCNIGLPSNDLERLNKELTCSRNGLLDVNYLKQKN
ncbi:unnamed protein product [Prunus armeniaca]